MRDVVRARELCARQVWGVGMEPITGTRWGVLLQRVEDILCLERSSPLRGQRRNVKRWYRTQLGALNFLSEDNEQRVASRRNRRTNGHHDVVYQNSFFDPFCRTAPASPKEHFVETET